jgi:hypothetical protein
LPKGTHGNPPKKTQKEHLNQWSLALHHLSLPTSYDGRNLVVSNVGCRENGGGVNILSQIVKGQELEVLLQVPCDEEYDVEWYVYKADSAHDEAISAYDTDDDQADGSDDNTKDDAIDDQVSKEDMKTYKAVLGSRVFRSHGSDKELQYKRVSQLTNDGGAATFACPDPHCKDTIDSAVPIYGFYKHLEHP